MALKKLVFSLLLFALASCGNRPQTGPTFAPGTLEKAVLARDVAGAEQEFAAVDSTTTFSAQDKEVVCWLRLQHCVQTQVLRWRWYAPDGTLYYDTEDYYIQPTGAYHPHVTSWHRLPIAGTAAADRPGRWRVVVEQGKEPIAELSFEIQASPPLRIGGSNNS